MTELLDFVAKIAWPLVALIGILILGPGGVLQKIIGELSEKLFRITDAVSQFKETANDFQKTLTGLQNSTGWIVELKDQLLLISSRIESINSIAQQLAISEGSRTLERTVGSDATSEIESAATIDLSPDEMFDDLRGRWEGLTNKLGTLVGDEFDGRSIGRMASRLVDKRRTKPLTQAQASLFESLHSQMKRFNRLQSTKDQWLTPDIYIAVVRAIDQANDIIS